MTKISPNPLHVVWFKRDLRVADHEALVAAAMAGPVLPLFIAEPELYGGSDASARQWNFAAESLVELRSALAALGQPLVVRTGDAVEFLDRVRRKFGIAGLWSHQETGNGWTFARDLRVLAWCREHGIAWHEPRQHGVVRRLRDRNGWAGRWERLMAEPQSTTPRALTPLGGIDLGAIPTSSDLGLLADVCPGRQHGGRSQAVATLGSFLSRRGANYRFEMSSPGTAFEACSRLSPHISALGIKLEHTAGRSGWPKIAQR